MKIRKFFKAGLQIALACIAFTGMAQLPECDKIYLDRAEIGQTTLSPDIYIYDPSLPVSATNPSLNTIAKPAGDFTGLAVSRVLSTGNGTYTFYTINITTKELWFYDPVTLAWINTGHQAGNALNPGGGGGYIYITNETTGQVYRYDGTGNAILITTVPEWAGSGAVWDIIADCEGNFYLLKALSLISNPSTFLRKYSSAGILLQEWIVNNPDGYGREGFHIVGNTIYTGYYPTLAGFLPTSVAIAAGTISGTTVDFSNAVLTPALPQYPALNVPSNWASCDVTQPLLPTITIASSETALCGARVVRFWITALENQGDTPAYQWLVNGTPVQGAADSFYNYTPQNGDVITCQLSSSDLCVTSMTTISNAITMVVDNAVQPLLSYSPNEFCSDVITTILPAINTTGGTFSATGGLGINAATGAITPSLSAPGEYIITYTNPPPVLCPLYSTTTIVNVYPPANASIETGKFKQPVCFNDSIVLHASEAKGSIYQWEPSERIIGVKDEPTVVVDRKMSGFVTLTVYAKGLCMDKDSVWIDQGKSCCQVFVPNAFTPNGDGLNDVLKADTKEIQAITNMRIYDRYGHVVFGTNNRNDAWDGTTNGKPCDAGVYYYLLSYSCDDGVLMQKKGDITLLR